MAFPRPYGRYILEDRLAMGGMAEIFRARTATAGFEKRVCIKRVLPHYLEEEDFVTMFRDEAKTAARLQHANVVQVFDFGEVDEEGGTTLYLAMELVEGCDLRRLADQSRKKGLPFSVGEVTQIGIDICRGLHHAHSLKDEQGRPLGIVHRDVSPHNVLVSKSGEVKVTDFGIARAAERATHTSTGVVKGKVAYMSPEQAEGKAFDHRLDQWALGVVLWELLCGERLFRGENDATILRKVLNVEVPTPSSLRPDVPPGLEQIILRALQGEPSARFRDLREMELALSRFLFSGVIDPATADVSAAYARIIDGGAQAGPRRTAVLEAAVVPAPQPPTLLTEDIAAVVGAGSSSDEGGSQVFVSSQGHAAAPGPAPPPRSSLQSAETVLEVGHEDMQAAVAAFEQQRSSSQRNLAARERSRPSTKAPAAPETLIGDGDLVEAARAATVDAGLDAADGTPATRTLVPVSERQLAAPGPAPSVATTARTPATTTTTTTGSRAPMAAAAAIVAMGAIAGLAIAVSGRDPTPPVTTTPATTTAPPPALAPSVPAPPNEAPTAPPPAPVPAPVVEVAPPAPLPATTTTTNPTPNVTTPPPPGATPAPAPAPAPTSTAPEVAKPEQKPGTVYVDVIGGWGNVTIGKKSYGETPVTLTLVPGRYTITLENGADGQKRSVPVTVTPGGKAQVREQFITAR